MDSVRNWFDSRTCANSLLDRQVVSERVFFPRQRTDDDPFHVQCRGARLACRLQRRFPDAGLLLHFHGNGELAYDYADGELDDLASRLGLNACFVEYRGYGMSTGSPALVAMLGDGERVVRALGVPPERIVVYGRSLGSIYAIELVHRLPRIAGLILESGIADMLERIRVRFSPEELNTTEERLAQEVSKYFDHRAKLGKYRGGVLVIHAEHDHIVHRSHGQRLHDWSGGTDKELVIFPRGDHNSLVPLNLESYHQSLDAFLRRLGMTTP